MYVRGMWIFMLILLVVTPPRVCTCQHDHHDHHSHQPQLPIDPAEQPFATLADSDHDCHCGGTTRISDTPKRVPIQLEFDNEFLPSVTHCDMKLSHVDDSQIAKQLSIPLPVPVYLATARLRT